MLKEPLATVSIRTSIWGGCPCILKRRLTAHRVKDHRTQGVGFLYSHSSRAEKGVKKQDVALLATPCVWRFFDAYETYGLETAGVRVTTWLSRQRAFPR
ncbi:hypothetical protein FKM82_025374 [Ascaphus truei]